MSVGQWIAARDVGGRLVVLWSEKSHLADLPASLPVVDDDEASVIGLDRIGRRFTRATDGGPFRFSEHLAGSPSPLLSRLADATKLGVDARARDEIDPTALRPPPPEVAAALRGEVDARLRAAARRAQDAREGTEGRLPVPTQASTHVPTEEELRQAEELRSQIGLMQLCLTGTHQAVLSRRYGLEDGVVRSNEEVGALIGRSAERVRQTVREALIRLRLAAERHG